MKIAPAPFYREGISFQTSEDSDTWSSFLLTPEGSQNQVKRQRHWAGKPSTGKLLKHLALREQELLGFRLEGGVHGLFQAAPTAV